MPKFKTSRNGAKKGLRKSVNSKVGIIGFRIKFRLLGVFSALQPLSRVNPLCLQPPTIQPRCPRYIYTTSPHSPSLQHPLAHSSSPVFLDIVKPLFSDELDAHSSQTCSACGQSLFTFCRSQGSCIA